MRADQLLSHAESEARRLAAASDLASELFRQLGSETAVVLADRLADMSQLVRSADKSEEHVRADMEAFLPTLIEQLRTMTSVVEQLVTAGTPLLELGTKLEHAVPRVN